MMKITEITKQLKISVTQFKNIARGLGLSLDSKELSFTEVGRIEEVVKIINTKGYSVDEALSIYFKEKEAAVDEELDTESLEAVNQIMGSAEMQAQLVGLTKAEMKKKEEKLRRAIAAHVDRVYNQKIREAVASGELRQAYEKLMAAERGGDIIEAEVLPGESTGQPALPDSSSSDT